MVADVITLLMTVVKTNFKQILKILTEYKSNY